MTEVLYKKVGRKYVPVRQTFDGYDSPTIPVGTNVLTYVYTDGGGITNSYKPNGIKIHYH